jgi:hypothetical protein
MIHDSSPGKTRTRAEDANNLVRKLERIAVRGEVDFNLIQHAITLIEMSITDLHMSYLLLTVREQDKLKLYSRWGIAVKPSKWIEEYKQKLDKLIDDLCCRNEMIQRSQFDQIMENIVDLTNSFNS